MFTFLLGGDGEATNKGAENTKSSEGERQHDQLVVILFIIRVPTDEHFK